MLFSIFVTTVLLHQVHFTATLYDCYYLRRICRIDPDCPDETAFYSKCQQTDSQTSLVLTYDANGERNSDNVGGISVYSLYRREALRESLYLLKEKLHQHSIEVREDVARNVDEHKLEKNYQSRNNINTPVKHFSRNKETENKGEELLTKYLILRNTASKVQDGVERQTGKKDLIDKAFDLVQLLIQQHGSRKENTDDFNKRNLNNGKEVLHDKNSQKREGEVVGYQGVSNTEVKDFVNHDHFEVATPVYTENDDFHQANDISIQDSEYQPFLNQQQQKQQQLQLQQKQYEILQPSVEIPVNKRSNDGTLILNASLPLSHSDAVSVGLAVGKALWNVTYPVLKLLEVNSNTATYALQIPSHKNLLDDDIDSVVGRLNNDKNVHSTVLQNTGTNIVGAGVTSHPSPPLHTKKNWDKITLFSIIVGASVLLLLSVGIGVVVVRRKGNEFPPLNFRKNEVMEDYQELCRTKMSIINSPHPEEQMDKKIEPHQHVSNVWGEEGSPYNMDITTGHVILNYMEDHLHDAERLRKEWEALCGYKADDSCTSVGGEAKHATKNRYRDVLPYDSKRVTLRESSNAFHSDYINASFITDTHPRTPAYIATQGPLDNTVGDFWQMVWERGIVVIINLTQLSDMGLPQCHRYWPTDGSLTYHIYEVHLISEHIWCDDYLVRSLYLKKLNTSETRTVTQFHFVSWSHLSVPQSPNPLLDFRRKVNRCYRGSQCPVLVHCNNGVGRTGTYILLDLVLNRMLKGVKEIDIAATLEHLRDQRGGMVKTKQQFEFVLLATAQEVSTILDAVTTK